MAAPDTELEIVSDDLKRVFGRLEKLIPGTTVIDSIRTFNFLDTQHHDHLEKGLVDAANKMAIELELLVNADRKELIKLITDLDRSGILPDNIKSYHVPLAFKSYAGINWIFDIRFHAVTNTISCGCLTQYIQYITRKT